MDFAQVTLVGYVGSTRLISERCFQFSIAVNTKDSYKGTIMTTWFDCMIVGDRRVPAATNAIQVGNRLFLNGNLSVTFETWGNGQVNTNKFRVLVGEYRVLVKKQR
jgi:hypothetical protein